MKLVLRKTCSGNWGVFYRGNKPFTSHQSSRCSCPSCPGHVTVLKVVIEDWIPMFVNKEYVVVQDWATQTGFQFQSEEEYWQGGGGR